MKKKKTEQVKVIEKFNLEDLLLSKDMCTEWRHKLIDIVYPKFGLTEALDDQSVAYIIGQLNEQDKQTAIEWLEEQYLAKRKKEEIVYFECKNNVARGFEHSPDALVVKAKAKERKNDWEICEIDRYTGKITFFVFPDDAIEQAKEDGLDLVSFLPFDEDEEAYINVRYE